MAAGAALRSVVHMTEPMSDPPGMPLFAARNVSKSFGAVRALVDVDVDVDRGEVVALVGDNGAGKSTLIKAIAGVQPADGARYRFAGREVAGRLDETAMEDRTRELFASLAVTTLGDVRGLTGALSGGQRQAGAIARCLVGSPRLLILDEPTAALGVAQTTQVLELIHRLREQGLAIVVISHNLDTVFDVADRVFVLRLGRHEATFDRRTSTREDIVSAIVGARPAMRAVAV
jgi:D-xylose transport system ATP-binding protein